MRPVSLPDTTCAKPSPQAMALQVMIFVVSRSADAVKEALVEGNGLKILGDWLLDAANPGAMLAVLCR